MPSLVWCDRARYVIKQAPGEIEDKILKALEEDEPYVRLDRASYRRGPEEVTLMIDKISAIEKTDGKPRDY